MWQEGGAVCVILAGLLKHMRRHSLRTPQQLDRNLCSAPKVTRGGDLVDRHPLVVPVWEQPPSGLGLGVGGLGFRVSGGANRFARRSGSTAASARRPRSRPAPYTLTP